MNFSEYQRIGGRILRGLIVEANGQSFQDLFWLIAPISFTDFEKVKPHGKNGDKKNDGYRKGTGIFFQLYSPEKPDENVSKGVKKMVEDFKGLFSFWNDIEKVKEFNFVFNDKFDGSYPELYEALSVLEKDFPEIKFKLFKADDLQRLFRELDPKKQIEILQLDSDEAILSYEALNSVSKHLKEITSYDTEGQLVTAPDFEEKIVFNHLSSGTSDFLKKHYEFVSQLQKYFSQVDDKDLRRNLQEKFTHLYEGAVKKYGTPTSEEISDQIFFDILACSSSHSMINPDIRRAALSLMSLYFESCDIYEEPS